MKENMLDKLVEQIIFLKNRVVELKGLSVFNEENSTIYQPQSKRLKNVKIREN